MIKIEQQQEVEFEELGRNDSLLEEIARSSDSKDDFKSKKKGYVKYLRNVEKNYEGFHNKTKKDIKNKIKAIQKSSISIRKELEKNLRYKGIQADLKKQILSELDSLKKSGVDAFISYIEKEFECVNDGESYTKYIEHLRTHTDINDISPNRAEAMILDKYLQEKVEGTNITSIVKNHLLGMKNIENEYDNKIYTLIRKRKDGIWKWKDEWSHTYEPSGELTIFVSIITAGIFPSVYHIKYGFGKRSEKRMMGEQKDALYGCSAYALMHAGDR